MSEAVKDAVMSANESGFDPSLALAAITAWDEGAITARTAPGIGPFLALEALAQTCGMHLRRRHGFMARAYLASVSDLLHDPGLGAAVLTIRAALTAETSAGAAYDVATDSGIACRILMGHEPLTSPDTFFRQRFEALCTPSCSA